MEVTAYQKLTQTTAIYPEAGEKSIRELMYLGLGISNEAGEVAGRIKKLYRDQGDTSQIINKDKIFKELGDVAWYLAMICNALDFDLNDVLAYNLGKLADRQERGVLGGSGDDR